MDIDLTLEILDEFHLLRIDVPAAAKRLAISVAEVDSARAYDLSHVHEIFRARSDRDKIIWRGNDFSSDSAIMHDLPRAAATRTSFDVPLFDQF